MKRAWAVAAIAALTIVAAADAWLFRPREVRVEIGAFDHPVAKGGWGRADRVDVDVDQAGGDRTSFYFRPLAGTGSIAIPFTTRSGSWRVRFRGTARIRSTVDAFVGAARLGSVLVPAGRWERSPGPWSTFAVEGSAPAG